VGYTVTMPTPGTSAQPKRVTPRAAPLHSGYSDPPQASSFGRIDLVNGDVKIPELIGTAASAPGYVYDRPLAALNTIGKDPGGKGLIDQAGDTIRGIPFLGDALSGGAQAIGNTVEGTGRLFPALANSWMATALKDNRGKGDGEKVDGLSAWFATSQGITGDMTVGELREIAGKRGFTAEDAKDIAAGRRSIYDYADRSISDNPLTDIAGRLVVDPLNLVGVGAATRIAGGAARVLPQGFQTMARLDKLATGMKAVEKAVIGSRVEAKGTIAGMAALRNGDVAGVTLNTLGRHLAMVSRGSSDFLRTYRKVAIGTTGAQLGLQELAKSGITDNTPLSPIFERLYEAAETMAADKPLSSGMVFNLWAAVNFPIRDGVSAMWKDTKTYGLGVGVGKYTVRTNILRRVSDIEKYVISELAPGKSIPEGRKYLIGRFGSEDRLNDHIQHFARSITAEDEVLTALMNNPGTTAEFTSAAEMNNRVLDNVTRSAIEQGRIDGRAVMEKMKSEYQVRRSDTTGRVARAWDPEDHIRQWNEWADRMEALSLKAGFEKGGNLVIGVMDGIMPKEHLQAAKVTLRGIANPDGIIPKHRMDDFLDTFPALDADLNDPSNFFARLRDKNSREVNYKEATQRIDRLLRDPNAISMKEYLWGVKEWEAREQKLAARSGTVLDERGMPDPNRTPDIQGAAVFTPTLKSAIRKEMGAEGLDYEGVLASRTDETRAIENDIGAVMRESGFNVHAATQGVVSVGGKKLTAVSLHMDSHTDTASMQLAGAIAARRAGTESSIIMRSGVETLAEHGLTMNAVHTRYDIGKMDEANLKETSRLLEMVTERFDGQYEWNDAAGVLHVLVKDGQEDAVQALSVALRGLVGDARMNMREAPAWFQVVHNDVRKGNRGRVPAGGVSARAVFAAAAGDLRLAGAERRLSERAVRYAQSRNATPFDERGVLGAVREGVTRGPEAARVRSDDLGADLEGVEPALSREDIANHLDPDRAAPGPIDNSADIAKLDAKIASVEAGDLDPTHPLTGQPMAATSVEGFVRMLRQERTKLYREQVDSMGAAPPTPPASWNTVGSRATEEPGFLYRGVKDEAALKRMVDRGELSGKDGAPSYASESLSEPTGAGSYPVVMRFPKGDDFDPGSQTVRNSVPLDRIEVWKDGRWQPLNGADAPPPRSPFIEGHDASGTQGQVIFLADQDLALDAMTPSLQAHKGEERAALGGIAPVQLEKIKSIELEMRQYDPGYRVKLAPKKGNVGTYYAGQGNTIKDLTAASQATSDLLYQRAWKPAAAFWDLLFRPVKTSALGRNAHQALYSELLGRTAHLDDDKTIRIKDIDSFLQTANAAARDGTLFGSQIAARGELLNPKKLADIASGRYFKDMANGKGGMFPGFSKEALEAIGGAGNIHKILDRTGSRFYRDLETRTAGKGKLGKAMMDTYSDARFKTATPRNYIRTWYHIFRFTMDPRFHIMNHLEADVLGLFKYGWGSTRLTGARRDGAADLAVKIHGRGPNAANDLTMDALASGVLDARHLEGYIGRSFAQGRVQSAREVLRTYAYEDRAMQILRKEFGGTEDEIIEGLEKMMYDFDTKGVEQSFTDEAVDAHIASEDMRAMEPLLIKLYDRNRTIYQDAVSTFHGNTNRSNIERLMNSYFLYWPISYQLKATKWLFDVLTKQSVGRKTNLGGAWAIDHLYDEHIERMKRDESYQRLFIDNPALWFTASMLLPITPFDLGLGFSRASRYMLASVGVVDDARFDENGFTAAMRLFMIGPNYTYELVERLERETKDRPKSLVVPIG